MCLVWDFTKSILVFRFSKRGFSFFIMKLSSLCLEISWVVSIVSAKMFADYLNRVFCEPRRIIVVCERIYPVFMRRYYVRATTRKLLRITPNIAMKPASRRPIGLIGEYSP